MTESMVSYCSALLASLCFCLFHFVCVFPGSTPVLNFFLALLLAIAAYAGFVLVLPRAQSLEEELAGMNVSAGINPQAVAALIRASLEKITDIREHSSELQGDVQATLKRITGIAQDIVEGFKNDPTDINRSKQFLFHYLDATLDIVSKYKELRNKKGGEPVEAVLIKSEQTLAEIEAVFQKQYQRNLANEAMELDVNLDVLQNMIKSEGL